jgi:uracil-DNA glycosylase
MWLLNFKPKPLDQQGYWDIFLKEQLKTPNLLKLKQSLADRPNILPSPDLIFQAYELTPYEQVRVVILGLEPYHKAIWAQGLAYSSAHIGTQPDILVNIKKELARSLNENEYVDTMYGHLNNWAEQGVFLLNLSLTVEEGKPHSHRNKGWQTLTDKTLEALDNHPNTLIFLLWGRELALKQNLIKNQKHLIIKAGHPSPSYVGEKFIGNDCFLKVNYLLKAMGQKEINWTM